ncbi:MAG TPA: SDR family oxidoreductase [Phycisphaerae bacterium]|nr:SDR family oxidoreductase [Phycisphaerae bacterium]
MDCLVTGGAGFIGSHVVEGLVGRGDSVRVLDNLATGKRENLAPWLGKIELLEGDITDARTCARACERIEVVFHLAALPSVPKSVADPVSTHRTNTDGTFNMLVAARDAGARRFVYAASSSAYGESATLPKVESMPPQPLSPYAVQKLTGEYYCSVFAKCYGLQTISMRYFNVFGPRQDPTSQYAAAIPAFVTAILRDCSPTIFGDGEQTRDFTYIENAVRANLLAADAATTNGEVINVACGEHVTVNMIVREINRLLNKNVPAKHDPPRMGDIRHSWADIGLAGRVIGYRPAVPFSEGLRRTIDWYAGNVPGCEDSGPSGKQKSAKCRGGVA